ncbi:MAG TPA: NnrS family protein [Ferrovibrio sp.]|jgi:uncharacterized protein involved in response to NO|uniref:NnrS family protein n=1 Tax=Ferrovibrio sp. TaxID=1917215 RepID=UPI002ED31637
MGGRDGMGMQRLPVHRLYFAGASIQGLLSVGLWIFARPAGVPAFLWHGHELVFGYAMAVIAGFLFTRTGERTALFVLLLWAAARLAWLLDYGGLPAALLSPAATLAIAAIAAQGFLRGIKRGQNAPFPLLLLALAAGDVLAQTALARGGVLLGLFAAVILIVVMGGRIAGAALSGLVQRAGGARIAPELVLEKLVLLALALSGLAIAADAPAVATAPCAAAAGGLMLWRMRRWIGALALAGAELRALAAGQVFIALGLVGSALNALAALWPSSAPLHLITVGGIGLTTVTMMLKTAAQRERRAPPDGAIAVAAICMGLAAVLRAAGDAAPAIAYSLAALLWMAALAICLIALNRK